MNTYYIIMAAMAVMAVIVFVALFFFKAGYGYLSTSNWGPKISNKIAWVLMEAPAFIFLLFYTKPLLHSLLPMEDILAWIANLCMVGALGVTTAYCIAGHKDKERTAQLFSTCVLIGLLFCRELGEFIMNIAIIVCCMLDMAVYTYRGLFPKKKKGGAEYA